MIYNRQMDLPAVITPVLLKYLRNTYKLPWEGLHGWEHWVRVWENGLHLALQNGADQTVVALFAFTHDMARHADHGDFDHGPRAAKIIETELHGNFFHLEPQALEQLLTAVRHHSRGLQEAGITIQTCWDADRLDLGRAGIRPSPARMCTREARDPATIGWAYQRSIEWRNKKL